MRNSERESGMRRIEGLVQSSERTPTFRNWIEEEMLVTGGTGETPSAWFQMDMSYRRRNGEPTTD